MRVRLRLRPDCFPVRTADGATWLVAMSARDELTPTVAGRLTAGQDSVTQRRDAYARGEADDDLVLGTADGDRLGPPVAHQLGELTPENRRALLALCEKPGLAVDDGEGADALVADLLAGGWLETRVADARPAYLMRPVAPPPARPAPVPEDPVLSRFAVVRRCGQALVVESPLAWCEIHLSDPALLSVVSGAGAPPGDEVAHRLLSDLAAAGLVVQRAAQEPADRWAPHELWFHARTRSNPMRCEPFGPAQALSEPLPARHVPFAGPAEPLHRPSASPLGTVLERRRSLRRHDDDTPVTTEQLGEFLFRCARNRWLVEKDGVEHISRPYPSASSGYELEIYPVVRLVGGLEPGLYHYDAQEHQLRRGVAGIDAPTRRLLRLAATMAGMPRQPQVLLVMTARFARLMRNYDAISYALIAKHVGVVQQVMYLVATELGLAPCALGTGDSAAFSAATGLDALREASVGEFILGSRPSAVGSP
ncbi:SagB family peptide dehydrogenase [Actinoplanes sp. NPDC051346]|uniref:SagB family peptide dehydrogenase n=1 Tax=Actinoplanes sp. NPDC051346 TaxID=3155048 RepID=UPI003431AE45